MKLYESSHPYYCGSYGGNSLVYESWNHFLQDIGNKWDDDDLVVRWDWMTEHGENYADVGRNKTQPDDNYRDGFLYIFQVLQRKGIVNKFKISVCRADEPSIAQWLFKRLEYLVNNVWS